MADFETSSTGGGPAVPLAPLKNTFWIDAQSADDTGPGLAVIDGSDKAFQTIVGAIAAFDNTSPSARFLCVQGDYSNANQSIDLEAVGCFVATYEGIGGAAYNLTEQAAIPPQAAPTNGCGYVFRNVSIALDDDTAASIDGGAYMVAEGCFFSGSVDVNGPIVATRCIFNNPVVDAAQSVFLLCTATSPRNWDTALAIVDEWTFCHLGRAGTIRVDADAAWLVGPAEQKFAAMQDADRTVNDVSWEMQGAWCAQGSLTVNRVLTVDMTFAPAEVLFHVWNWDSASGFTLTVNGTVVAGLRHATFQNVGGTLTLVSVEVLT
jgi:hypothetical protein